ncbi:PKD domain-containing protein [Kitasatospora sp. NPDC049258]|uniref:PKD domain-containing protein n=1 Tax=Kitasatospora sp. NPDC049258 TaxID=3155394 RepID=UPI00342B7074
MRSARTAAVAALVLSVTGILPVAGSAQAEAENLYVDGKNPRCSDAGAGSQAVPYCTVSAAARAVRPGQTVRIAPGEYPEQVELTVSGTPAAPITFTATAPQEVGVGGSQPHAFTLTGVHDVRLTSLVARTTARESVLVTDSTGITLDRIELDSGLRVTGRSSDVTVSRSFLTGAGSAAGAVVVDPGVVRTVLTTNEISGGAPRGVAVTDAPGTVVTANTVQQSCGLAVELAGGSAGSTVENNVLLTRPGPVCAAPGRVAVSVSAASVPGTTADYNVVGGSTAPAYLWAGRPYPDPGSLRAGTGQGGHDLAWTGGWENTPEGSPLIDSADALAPGMLDTDRLGNPRVDDPLVADSGTGPGPVDRGAVERQDPLSAVVLAAASTEPGKPLDVVLTGQITSPWYPVASSSLDFGDGSPVLSPAVLPTTHTFPRQGRYRVTAKVTDTAGRTASYTRTAAVDAPAEIRPVLQVVRGTAGTGPDDRSLRVAVSAADTVSPWPVARYTFDFGDGTAAVEQAGVPGWNTHEYAAAGTYTVTETVLDDHGRSATTSHPVTVGSVFVPVAAARILDTRSALGAPGPLGPDGVLRFQVTGRGGVPAGGRVTAVLLNLTATQASADTHVTAFPGSTAPTASNLNVRAGQDVANAVLVPVAADGTVALSNHNGQVQLIADVQGYYTTDASGPALQAGLTMPLRALDTRSGLGGARGQVGPDSVVRVKVRGPGLLPSYAKVAVLNVTATEGSADSHVTASTTGAPQSASSLNFGAGRTVSNQVTVPIADDGTVALRNHNGSVHLIADIQGLYVERSGGGYPILTVAPTRLLDTRTDGGRLGAGGTVKVKVAGRGGLPEGVAAVIVNLTAVGASADSWLGAYPSGSSVPVASDLNVAPGATTANLAMVPVGSDGSIEVSNNSGSVDLLVDLQGYIP